MAASILWSLRRLQLFSGTHPAVLGCRGLRSRPPISPVSGDEDELEESEGTEEQEVLRMLRRRGEAIRFKQIKKEMEPPGSPERRLTWNAMEQIRYLNQEFPEEWTLQRLAAGFNVDTDVIRRVLKSKFVPSEARKMKQNASVSRRLGQITPRTEQDQLKLMSSKHPTQHVLGDGKSDRQLLVNHSPPLLPSPKTSDISHVAVRGEGAQRRQDNSLIPQIALHKVQDFPPSPALTSANPSEPVPSAPVEEDWETLDETWDGEVISDTELEELSNSGLENKMQVIQKGSEYFDCDGNFLYRI
ncbi:neugrin [Lithobates pipiens]